MQEYAAQEIRNAIKFIEDNTVFKGTARYDGTPVIDEAFVAIGIGGTTPDADMDFAGDEDVSA